MTKAVKDPEGYLTLLLMKSPEDIINTIGGLKKFEVNDWGSCQYTSALNMFKTLETLKKFDQKKVFKLLHLPNIQIWRVRPVKEIVLNS